MRKILSIAVGVGLAALAWCAEAPATAAQTAKKSTTRTTTKKKTAPAKTGAAARPGTRTPGTRTSASRIGRKPVARTTWRNRQMAPSPERYKEVQGALVSKGYLKPEEAGGAWGQSSTDALKRFQADQNLESNGKINSLSLIALGLGPKHDAAPPPKPLVP